VVHQEIHQWWKFGESITFNSKYTTMFQKAGRNYGQTDGHSDRWTDRQTIQTLYVPRSSRQGHKNNKLDRTVV